MNFAELISSIFYLNNWWFFVISLTWEGSGSTLIACEQTDRTCRMIELDEKFVDVIVNRFIELVGSDKDVSLLRDGKEYKYEDVINLTWYKS